ncbi:MAG: M23 family metallopeptidase [Blastochloris sp.]|nr:M23 family metallopeptidase [Blastochloris sp.]
MFWIRCLMWGMVLGVAGGQSLRAEGAVHLIFPTANRGLVEGRPEEFYQPTISKRAISGMYGFVRSSEPEPARYFDLFHEGIDIRPLQRDAKGEPLDQVVAMASGQVVYVNKVASKSNYGRYVVLRHGFGKWEMYSTYGHLASVAVSEGRC